MITLTIPDLVTSLQETLLVLRHGRMDEEADAYGEARRDLYRQQSNLASDRELRLNTHLKYAGVDFEIQMRRLYHHDGMVVRVVYLTAGAKLAKSAPKLSDVGVVQFAAWLASLHFTTPPRGCRVVMHKTDEAMAVVESKVFDYPLLAGEQIQSAVEDRLAAIAKNLDMPAESLPECSAEERFALTTDAYSKCRTQCRVRNSCAQYAAVRAEGSRKFAAARTTLASL